MGLRDYEYESTTKVPIFLNGMITGEESILDKVKKNKLYLGSISEFLKPYDIVCETLNRKCFTYTKLREEIFFITCRVYRKGTNTYNKFIYTVNERSIWRRFNFYRDSNTMELYANMTPSEILKKAISENMYITVNIMPFEYDDIKKAYLDGDESEQLKIKSYNLENKSPIEIVDFEHKSKLLWLKYFEGLIGNSSLLLGSYKTPGDVAYYDVVSENNKRYNIMRY